MRYAIPVMMLVVSLLFTGTAVLHRGHIQVISAGAISDIADLRTAQNMEQCQRVEADVGRQFRSLRDGQRFSLAFDCLAIITSLAALITEARRKRTA